MKKLILFLTVLSLIWVSCENQQKPSEKKTQNEILTVFAVNYPLAYFAERIGGDKIDLYFPIPEGSDPAYWVPMASLEKIQAADLILLNGANYAKWMEKVSLPSSRLVNTSKAFKDQYIKVEEGETHSHGAEGEHVHYGYAFTTWLDFKIALGQAEAIKDALVAKDPDNKESYEQNFLALSADLLELDNMMTEVAGMLPPIALFGSHPVYQYLGAGYNLEIIEEHWEPGEMPSDKQWHDFKHNLDHHPANVMLWEAEPLEELKSNLRDKKIECVVFNPCGNTPESGDFITTMKENIKRLEQYINEFC